jgi:hypothetical protein
MGQRLQLQANFEALLGSDKVYFQPPANVRMEYPCIVYKRDEANTVFADNNPWRYVQRYMVTIIDRDPDGLIRDKVAKLPLCLYNRFYTAHNLNHDVFILYF